MSRRIPPATLEVWDDWLSGMMKATQDALGEDWLTYFLTGPIWNFEISPGLLGPSGHAGVLIPSVDKVGRYFPMTVLADFGHHNLHTIPSGPDLRWFEEATTIILSCLSDTFDLEAFDRSLTSLGAPISTQVQTGTPSHEPENSPTALVVDPVTGIAAVLKDLAPSVAPHSINSGDSTIWWTTGADHVAATVARTPGMPTKAQTVAFWNGQWALHGWTQHEA